MIFQIAKCSRNAQIHKDNQNEYSSYLRPKTGVSMKHVFLFKWEEKHWSFSHLRKAQVCSSNAHQPVGKVNEKTKIPRYMLSF